MRLWGTTELYELGGIARNMKYSKGYVKVKATNKSCELELKLWAKA